MAAVARTGGVGGRLKRAVRAWKERRREEHAVMRGAAVRRQEENGRRHEKVRAEDAGQEIYDMWAPRFSITPVKPMTRFRTPVDCIGAVHPRLQQ